MRLAIISDTHLPKGRRALPEGCVARLRSADAILHAGDFAVPSVLEDLRGLGPPVHAVHGNVDAPELRSQLPAALDVTFGDVTIGIVHDAGEARGRLPRARARFPTADAVIFGHSHLPLLERDEDGFQIFNPGSPTERRRAASHTMGVAGVGDGRISFELVTLD